MMSLQAGKSIHGECHESTASIKLGIDAGERISMMYLKDLTDAEMMHRPCAGGNHINWQVGHLLNAEHGLINKICPGAMPPLPADFSKRYSKEQAGCDDPQQFCKKDELLAVFREQRAATLAALEKQSDDAFDAPSGIEFVPTVGAVFSLQGSHWIMHAGQWVVIRRQLGRKPLF
jgi:hypothetical protein